MTPDKSLIAAFNLLGALLVCACATAGESQRLLVVGTPTSAEYTEWRRDGCRGGIPTKSDDFECPDGAISHGGEIHAVKLKRVTVVLGTMPANLASVAIARHGMKVSRRDKQPWLIVLERSPDDFAKATGIGYIARAYGIFEDGEACLYEPLSEISGLPAAPSIKPSSGVSCYRLSDIMNAGKTDTNDINR